MSFPMQRRWGGDSGGRDPTYGTRHGSLSSATLLDGLHYEVVAVVNKPMTVPDADVNIEHLAYVGSYNWVDMAKPTIVVPGSPTYWRDRPFPYQVPVDTQEQFVDQAGDRMGSQPLYPLIRAVDLMAEARGEEFDWGTVDFVADRNSLRKLLSWVQGKAGAKAFKIATQLAGKHTVLLSRWEARTREAVGHWPINFQRESTHKAPGCEDIPTISHHRVVRYNFGGIDMVVRFSVDACTRPSAHDKSDDSGENAARNDADTLSSILSNMHVSEEVGQDIKVDTAASTPELDVIRGGTPVAQSSLIEITTRTERNAQAYNWIDTYPQLYFSQTAYRYMAIHNSGLFREVRKCALDGPRSEAIRKKLQGDFLRALASALKTIQDLVIQHGEQGRLTLIFQDGTLRAFQRKSRESCLPDAMLRRFEG